MMTTDDSVNQQIFPDWLERISRQAREEMLPVLGIAAGLFADDLRVHRNRKRTSWRCTFAPAELARWSE